MVLTGTGFIVMFTCPAKLPPTPDQVPLAAVAGSCQSAYVQLVFPLVKAEFAVAPEGQVDGARTSVDFSFTWTKTRFLSFVTMPPFPSVTVSNEMNRPEVA